MYERVISPWFIGQNLPDDERSSYSIAIDSVRRPASESGTAVKGLALEKQSRAKSKKSEEMQAPNDPWTARANPVSPDPKATELPVLWFAAGMVALGSMTALMLLRSRHA